MELLLLELITELSTVYLAMLLKITHYSYLV